MITRMIETLFLQFFYNKYSQNALLELFIIYVTGK